jgi:hypothetical protein
MVGEAFLDQRAGEIALFGNVTGEARKTRR